MDDEFVRLVRDRFDRIAPPAGFAFNGVFPGDVVGVLYEGRPADYVAAYPGLVPDWDDGWIDEASCVDLWLKLRRADQRIDVHLEHWGLADLAARFGDPALVERAAAARTGGADLAARLDVVAEVVELAFREGRTAPSR